LIHSFIHSGVGCSSSILSALKQKPIRHQFETLVDFMRMPNIEDNAEEYLEALVAITKQLKGKKSFAKNEQFQNFYAQVQEIFVAWLDLPDAVILTWAANDFMLLKNDE
jgi:hypothetical protein